MDVAAGDRPACSRCRADRSVGLVIMLIPVRIAVFIAAALAALVATSGPDYEKGEFSWKHISTPSTSMKLCRP